MKPRSYQAALLAALLAAPSFGAAPVERLVLRLRGVEENDHRPPVVTAVAVSEDGSRLAAGGDDHRLRVWDAATGAPVQVLAAHEDWVRAAKFAGGPDRLASVGADHTVCLWDLAKDEPRLAGRRLAGGPLLAVAWRPDGLALATVGFGDRLRRYDLSDDDSEPVELACSCEDTRAVAFSPDGRWLAAAGRNGVVRVWDQVATGGPRDLPSDGRRVRALAFSPDGRILAAGGDGPAVRFWRLEDGAPVATTPEELLVRPGKVHSLTFLDETTLAVGGTRNAIGLWNTDDRTRRASLTGHTGTVAALATSGDGRVLVSGSFDTTVRAWDIDPGDLPATPAVAAASGATTR